MYTKLCLLAGEVIVLAAMILVIQSGLSGLFARSPITAANALILTIPLHS